jgi:RNA polymerase sigma-B factor
MHYVRDSERLIRAPRGIRKLERRWSSAERELRFALQREPSEAEVTEFLAATPAQAREIRVYRSRGRAASLEVLNGCGADVPAHDIDHLLDRLTVERILRTLPSLQRRIILAIHFEHRSIVELSARLGYSRRHVTRLHRVAMERLRSACGVGVLGGAELDGDVPLSHGG